MSEQSNKPNTYAPEFKESAIQLALESEQPIAQTARDLGVNPNTLHTWISRVCSVSQHSDKADNCISPICPDHDVYKQTGFVCTILEPS